MSVHPLTLVLQKQLKLHKSLYGLGLEKTDILKEGSLEGLNELLKKEQKHLTAIGQLEKERAQIVSSIVPDAEQAVLNDCLPLMPEKDRVEIAELQQALTDQLKDLKEINELNQELIHLSMQYVTMNLDLLMPNDMDNYKKQQDGEDTAPSISLFDSKA
ncbi:hypothetical protein B9K06_12865 [Bacillus sp. OG2]|nr:hypothetical protein B9K06_12865 [Bacillus sp. OG2]